MRPRRDRQPIQGNEVELGATEDPATKRMKVCITFLEPDGKKRAEKVQGELERSLTGWGEVVQVGYR